MIDRREILDLATQSSLTPHVIEKDYVLGWMLAGIYAHDELTETWLFKGGSRQHSRRFADAEHLHAALSD